jgi:hypothetical protein
VLATILLRIDQTIHHLVSLIAAGIIRLALRLPHICTFS